MNTDTSLMPCRQRSRECYPIITKFCRLSADGALAFSLAAFPARHISIILNTHSQDQLAAGDIKNSVTQDCFFKISSCLMLSQFFSTQNVKKILYSILLYVLLIKSHNFKWFMYMNHTLLSFVICSVVIQVTCH